MKQQGTYTAWRKDLGVVEFDDIVTNETIRAVLRIPSAERGKELNPPFARLYAGHRGIVTNATEAELLEAGVLKPKHQCADAMWDTIVPGNFILHYPEAVTETTIQAIERTFGVETSRPSGGSVWPDMLIVRTKGQNPDSLTRAMRKQGFIR